MLLRYTINNYQFYSNYRISQRIFIMSHYKINELFETIQGEGSFTGQPSIFLRLQGCPVGCSWCDTKHTWEINLDREVSRDVVLNKNAETDDD